MSAIKTGNRALVELTQAIQDGQRPLRDLLESIKNRSPAALSKQTGSLEQLKDVFSAFDAVKELQKDPQYLNFVASSDMRENLIDGMLKDLEENFPSLRSDTNFEDPFTQSMFRLMDQQITELLDDAAEPMFECLLESVASRDQKGYRELVEAVVKDLRVDVSDDDKANLTRLLSDEARALTQELNEMSRHPVCGAQIFKAIVADLHGAVAVMKNLRSMRTD